MTVTKINGFRAPYRSTTFQKQADTLAQANGLIKMTGIVYESGSDVMVPPYAFIQNGLIVESDTQKVVAKPSMEAPYYLTVSAPTSNPVDDLSYQFAKAPTDISSNEVVVAAYDGQEWRMFPFVSLKGIYDQIKQDRLDFGSVGPINGLYTTENGSDYETSGGTLIDPAGEVKVLTESRLFPQVGDDPDWSRVDRIVYRRALDAEKRIGERTFCLGGTYNTSPTALYTTLTHDDSLVREKVKSVIGSDNAAHMLVASGYGDNWQIIYMKQSSDRQTELVAPMVVAAASSKHFDVLIDNNDEIHLLYISGGDVYWKKLDDVGADVAGPTQIDTQPNDCTYLTLATDPHYSKLYAVWSSLISTDENNLFFKTLNLNGNTITEAKQLTTGSTNHIRPHLHVTEDLWVYLAWEAAVTSSIWYSVFDDIGEEIIPPSSVSGATERIGVGTLVDQASRPRVAVSNNKSVFITFLQDKGGAAYGISVWNDGEAFMQELVDPSESFDHYGFYLDSTFNGLHFILSRSANLDYTKLEGREVSFTLPLASAGSSGVHTVMDKFGSMFHSWTAPLSGTFTNYDTGLGFTHTGPQVVVGALNSITLQNTDMLLLATAPSQEPKKGERVIVSGSAGGSNDGTYYIDNVELVSLDAADDYYQITMTTAFPVLEAGSPTADLGAPDGNGAYFEKSTSETSDRAFRKTTLESDVLLARIIRPGPGILNYYNVSPAVGPDFIVPHGTEVSIDWSLTAVDNLTISSDLNLYDMLNATNYLVADGSYPMAEGDALYVVLDPSLPTITPQVTPLNSLPFADNMRVLGAVINGYFNPFLLSIGGMGVLDPNEQVVLGEDVPQELRSKIGFVSETEIELYPYTKGTDQLDTYPQFMGETNLIAGQNTHIKLIKGRVSWVKPNADELVFLSEAFLQIPELAESRNRIAPQTVTLDADGKVAWVSINRLTGVAADLTVNVSAIADVELDGSAARDVFIIARRTGDDLIINSSRLLPGSSKDLDSDLTIENKTLLGSGVDESTFEPAYSTRGAPERNLDDSQGILDALTSVDVELDKFFGQLRIVPHNSDLDKVVVTGVDLVMKDGSILSQEISSLLMSFEGAVIDFTTGEVFEDDGLTPLGIDFTPTTLADTEHAWYSVAVISSAADASNATGIQFIVIPGSAAVDEVSAEFPPFGGQKKIGMVLVKNNGGNIERVKIRQIGVGSGSGGGGTGTGGKLIGGGDWSVAEDPDVLSSIASSNVGLADIAVIDSASISVSNTFIPDIDLCKVGELSISLSKANAPVCDMVVDIVEVIGGVPSTTVLGTSQPVAASSLLDSVPTDVVFTFANTNLLSDSVTYGFVLRTINVVTLDASNYIVAHGRSGQGWQSGSLVLAYYSSITWSPSLGLFCAVTESYSNGSVSLSSDGVNWSSYLHGIPSNWRDVAWSPSLGLFCAVGSYDNHIMTSPDGINWTVQTPPSTGQWYCVDWSETLGIFSALKSGGGVDGVMVSSNGVNWTGGTVDSVAFQYIRWIPDLGLFIATTSDTRARIYRSSDGLNWTYTSVADYGLRGVAWSPELSILVLVSERNAVYISSDGVAWTQHVITENWRRIDWSVEEQLFYVAGRSSANSDYAVSADGINWTLNPGMIASDSLSDVIYESGSKILVLLGRRNQTLAYKPDLYTDGHFFLNSGGWTAEEDKDIYFTMDLLHEDFFSLSWSEDAYISLPGLTNGRNTIPAGNLLILEGQAAYALINQLAGIDYNLTVQVDNIEDIFQYDPNLFIFARGVSDGAVIGNSFKLIDGESKELDSGLSVQNRSLLGNGVTEATSDPDYSTRGAPERNLDDSQGILDGMTSLDIELDKFFGQLRITAHNTDLDKVVITGVDLVMKDGSVLSQEISSFLMKFEGAIIDFTTGDVFKDDMGLSPLGVNFTPTVLANTEYAWYSIAIVSAGVEASNAMGIQFTVIPGSAAVDEVSAEFPPFGGQKKIGMVLVKNNGGNIERVKIRQMGIGSGFEGGVPNAKLIEGGDWAFEAGETPDNLEQLSFPNDIYALLDGQIKIAQSFTLTSLSQIKSFSWRGYKSGTPTGYLQASIYTDSPGLPGSLLYSSDELDLSGLTTTSSGVVYTLNFSDVFLQPGNYWVVLEEGVSGWSFSGGYVLIKGTYTDVLPESVTATASPGWETTTKEMYFILEKSVPFSDLSWSEDAYISLPGLTNGRNTIPADTVSISEGQAAYVLINQLAGIDDNLTVQVDNIEDIFQYDPNLFIFARGVSDGAVIGNSFKLVTGGLKFWKTRVASSNEAINSNDQVFGDTSGGALILTMPLSPSIGDLMRVIDYDGSWDSTNKVTLNGNGKNINGNATLDLVTPNGSIELVYNGTEWRVL